MEYRAMIRYGAMGLVGHFKCDFPNMRLGDDCLVRTERGIEHGRVLCALRACSEECAAAQEIAGEVVRKFDSDDFAKLKMIQEVEEPREFEFCRKRIQERGLPMRLVSVEHLFGGSKVIFYFLADGRVDFRELVKDLAQEYRTRIEMRQIGVRDEARLLADFEHCGRELCCKTFIKNLEPVTMKMAKSQKATLDPTKISGRCGRLMCCLRFEDRTYEDLKKALPRKGTRVSTPSGDGTVTGQEVLGQVVKVELDGGAEESFAMDQIRVLTPAAPPAQEPEPESTPDE